MFDINYASIQEIHQLFKEKKMTVRNLVLSYLSRIVEIDKCDGGLNSVLEINPDALFIADIFDKKLQDGEEMTPLFGIPVLLKDNISTGDKMHTSAGSVALTDNYAPYDAHIVKCLREAGAVILGKANMTEFANYMNSGAMPNGYSSRGGKTLNPYDKTKETSGSSAGSAVAVAANLCSVAVGTETCGSIISPSKYAGIVGIKPTLGLLSRHGIIPISFTLDTPGPMTRNVADAAALLGAMTGKDENDPATFNSKQKDYTQYLDKNGLKGARVGIHRMFTEDCDKEYLEQMENIVNVIKEHGAECVELPSHSLQSGDNFGAIMTNEFKSGINYYLASMKNNNIPQTLNDIILYNQNHAKEALKYGQNGLTYVQNNSSGIMTEPEYIKAILKREELIQGFDNIFTENKIDVMFCVAGTGLPAMTGFPGMTIPVGMDKNNLPVGSFWVARRFDEAALFKVTYAVEQILGLSLNL